VKRRLLALRHLAKRSGASLRAIARRIGMAPQTLCDWVRARRERRLDAAAPGRPRRLLSRELRASVIEVIAETRGRIGVPSLKACFRSVARRRLRRLLDAYRRVHRPTSEHLAWTTPGTVWAMDFTEVNPPIDGRYDAVLSVRDLASTRQLATLPADEQTARVAAGALRGLFAAHGPPLVLKSDNGSHFTAGMAIDLLDAAGVAHLRSPVQTPQYNGAVEAGIGATKARLHHVAATHGRPDSPTCDDLEEARLEGNAEARPWGPSGHSPDDRWSSRPPITADQRRAFHAALDAARLEETRRMLQRRAPTRDNASFDTLDTNDRVTVTRRSIRRALLESGFLITRRSATSSTHLASVLSEN
jgi:transposase InsO family protein